VTQIIENILEFSQEQFRRSSEQEMPLFPIKWVTDIFEVSQVQVFALHYFRPNTTIGNLDLLLFKLFNVIKFDLSFEKLDFEKVARLLPTNNINYHL